MIGPFGIVVAGVLLIGAVVLVQLFRRGHRHVRPRQEWRLVQATRVLGLIGGAVAAYLVAGSWSLGRGQMLAPAVFGLVLVVAVAAGEALVRPKWPAGARSASLRTRRIRDYLPRWTAWSVLGTGAALAATLILTTVTASRDPWTGGMRDIAYRTAECGGGASPYPGSFYSLPLVAVLIIVLAVAGVAAIQVVRRPRGLGETEADDDLLRKRSLTVIVAATGVAIAFSHAGVAFFAGTALGSLGQNLSLNHCGSAWFTPAGWLVGLSAAPALLIGIWCLVRTFSNDSLERSTKQEAAR